MKRKRLIAVTAAVFIIAAVTLLLNVCRPPMLLLRDGDTGRVYAKFPVSEGTEFSVTFNHSVNKTDETELYQIRGGSVYLTGCIYYSFGAGVAEVLDESWTLSYGDGGEMIISDINMKIPRLRYVVGTVSDHMMHIAGQDISLRELCGRNSRVDFIVGR